MAVLSTSLSEHTNKPTKLRGLFSCCYNYFLDVLYHLGYDIISSKTSKVVRNWHSLTLVSDHARFMNERCRNVHFRESSQRHAASQIWVDSSSNIISGWRRRRRGNGLQFQSSLARSCCRQAHRRPIFIFSDGQLLSCLKANMCTWGENSLIKSDGE